MLRRIACSLSTSRARVFDHSSGGSGLSGARFTHTTQGEGRAPNKEGPAKNFEGPVYDSEDRINVKIARNPADHESDD